MNKPFDLYKTLKYLISVIFFALALIYILGFAYTSHISNYDFSNATSSIPLNFILAGIMNHLYWKDDKRHALYANIIISIIGIISNVLGIFKLMQCNLFIAELFTILIIADYVLILVISCLEVYAINSNCKDYINTENDYTVERKSLRIFVVTNCFLLLFFIVLTFREHIIDTCLGIFYLYVIPSMISFVILNKLILRDKLYKSIIVYTLILIASYIIIYASGARDIWFRPIKYYMFSLTIVFALFISYVLFRICLKSMKRVTGILLSSVASLIIIGCAIFCMHYTYKGAITQTIQLDIREAVLEAYGLELPTNGNVYFYENYLSNIVGRRYLDAKIQLNIYEYYSPSELRLLGFEFFDEGYSHYDTYTLYDKDSNLHYSIIMEKLNSDTYTLSLYVYEP